MQPPAAFFRTQLQNAKIKKIQLLAKFIFSFVFQTKKSSRTTPSCKTESEKRKAAAAVAFPPTAE
ncbi:MAG: hypothetical protein IJK07_08905 [Bacteroidales bacterium]|nr:hypothetical protein [Bacteroidales bacterium]